MNQHHALADKDQSFWQLAAIQLSSVASLPILITSVILIQSTSLVNALLVVLISNLLLWIIRYALISMSHDGRKSTIDISRDYFGNSWGLKDKGIYLIAALLLISTAMLFSEETALVCKAITSLTPINEGKDIDPYMQLSVAIGVLSTVFCVSGMIALRWLATISLPIILVSFIVLLSLSPNNIKFVEHTSLSLSGISFMLGVNLAITIDLPTFFRHSRSWKSSVNALTVIQIISFFIGIGGLFLGAVLSPWMTSEISKNFVFSSTGLSIAFIVLILLSAVCANVSNVYSASVGWEVMAPKALVGRKEYLILGLLLTIFFISVVDAVSLKVPLEICDAALINLCLVIIVGFVVFLFTRRSPSCLQRTLYLWSWLSMTTLNTLQIIGVFLQKIPTLTVSAIIAGTTLGLSFLFSIVFKPSES